MFYKVTKTLQGVKVAKNKERLKQCPSRGVQPFGVSGPHWKKKSCLGPHIKYIVTHNHKKKKTHNVFSTFTILCWAAFIAILGRMWPTGCELDTPVPGHRRPRRYNNV